MKKKKIQFGFAIITVILFMTPVYANDCIWVPEDLYGESFETYITDIMAFRHIPSLAFSVLNGTEVFYSASFGEQLGTDIAYHMMSASKMFTGVAILQLQEQGLLNIDDDINSYLPYEIRNPHYPSTPITLKHLLSHRSGTLRAEDSMDTYWACLDNGTYTFPEITYEFLHVNGSIYSEDNWYTWKPGTNAVYSDIGFDILTTILTNVTSQPYFDYVEENIFIPLGMHNTHPFHTDYLPENLAVPYNWNSTTQINEVIEYFPSQHNPGGGGYFSTVEDMAKFMLAHMNEGEYNGTSILTPASIELMHTRIENSDWALGWRTRVTFGSYTGFQGHGGGPWMGFAALNYMRGDLGITLLINQGVNPDREGISAKIYEKAIELHTEKTCPTSFYLLPVISFFAVITVLRKIKKER